MDLATTTLNYTVDGVAKSTKTEVPRAPGQVDIILTRKNSNDASTVAIAVSYLTKRVDPLDINPVP